MRSSKVPESARMRVMAIWFAVAAAAWPADATLAQAHRESRDDTPVADDGPRGFDWEFGAWKTRLRRLAQPLSGSRAWLEYEGTSVVRPLLDGRANLVELKVAGQGGRIEGVSLRLYDPAARQWRLNYASARSGTLAEPVHGGFDEGGRGEFHGIERLDGRTVLVRFTIQRIDADTARFEQAYSDDGGRTWETNWIATDTRLPGSQSAEPL